MNLKGMFVELNKKKKASTILESLVDHERCHNKNPLTQSTNGDKSFQRKMSYWCLRKKKKKKCWIKPFNPSFALQHIRSCSITREMLFLQYKDWREKLFMIQHLGFASSENDNFSFFSCETETIFTRPYIHFCFCADFSWDQIYFLPRGIVQKDVQECIKTDFCPINKWTYTDWILKKNKIKSPDIPET